VTTATVAEITGRVSRKRARVRPSCVGLMLDELRDALEQTTGIRWPNDRYRADPVGFAREVLGVDPWEKQREILEAVRDHLRVTVRSGHKIGKSHTAAIIAFWFFCSFNDARVVMSSTTARQVDEILWREIRKMRSEAGLCLACKKAATQLGPAARSRLVVPCEHSAKIDGKMGDLARSGFRASDMRQIVGFTARDAEAVAGISGENLLYIVDEASGVPDVIFEAMEGNRAGGARLVLISNPTRTEGEFYRSHTEKALVVHDDGKTSGFYKAIHVSSEDTPNATSGRKLIPGLAMAEWIEEKRAEWGVDSPLYKVRVRGEFVENEDGKILSVHALLEAETRWKETPDDGRLHIGIDPAGPGLGGDESAFVLRRGRKMLGLFTFRGLTAQGHVGHLLGFLRDHSTEREQRPIVAVDREGPIGAELSGTLAALLERPEHRDAFVLVPVRASDRAIREPHLYDRVRDELWASLARWISEGGAILEDARLSKELHAPEWIGQVTGRLKATPKDEIRKALGRSPDRADALALAVWEPAFVRAAASPPDAAPPPAAVRRELPDAYQLDGFGDGGGNDPVYGP
jgi:phage terminase large subunit